MKVFVFEGRVDAVKGKYARIYVGGEEGQQLAKYNGKKVKGIVVVYEDSQDACS